MKPFDNYEISPARRFNDQGQPDPDGNNFEVCQPHEAHVWTLYGHIDGEGVDAIADFPTREDAERLFQQITGRLFGTWEENRDHIRRMHAAEELLAALEDLVSMADDNLSDSRIYEARKAMAKAKEAA